MKNLKRISFLLICILFVSNISAQSEQKFTGSLLWKVSGKDIKEPSYIVGTHHLIEKEFHKEIAGLEDAMNTTQQVAGEIEMNDKAAMQQTMMAAVQLPAGETYQTMLSETDCSKLDENLKAVLGAGLAQLGAYKPMFIGSQFSVILYMKNNPGFNPVAHMPIDEFIQQNAVDSKKSVIGLETIEVQIKTLFNSKPQKTLAEELLCQTSQSVKYGSKTLIELNEFYKKGDLLGMYKLAYEDKDNPCPTDPADMDILLKNRNDNWLKKLPAIMKDKPTLIAVGALHLVGEDGLLFQLDKMGYKVEAVTK